MGCALPAFALLRVFEAQYRDLKMIKQKQFSRESNVFESIHDKTLNFSNL